ncbi:MAG: class I SAM-dependent methyltransferase [Isosphaeraceae bacterium]
MKWIGPLQGRNRIAAALYDGPDWRRFEPWERLFLWFQGPGERRARRKVLRYLPDRGSLRVLEVGIGAGANVPLLAPDWEVHGVDFAGSRLEACASRFPELRSRLIQAEAESLPYGDSHFDAVFTVGAINYFRDPHAALSEMRAWPNRGRSDCRR